MHLKPLIKVCISTKKLNCTCHCRSEQIEGSKVTPFILDFVDKHTGGLSRNLSNMLTIQFYIRSLLAKTQFGLGSANSNKVNKENYFFKLFKIKVCEHIKYCVQYKYSTAQT